MSESERNMMSAVERNRAKVMMASRARAHHLRLSPVEEEVSGQSNRVPAERYLQQGGTWKDTP